MATDLRAKLSLVAEKDLEDVMTILHLSRMTAGECRAVNTYPNPVHNHKNKYHAEIHDSEQLIEIGLLKAMQLAAICQVVNTIELSSDSSGNAE